MNWNLLTCAFRGHVTFAPTEPAVREQLRAGTAQQAAWQCLRCATFVPGEPLHTGPAAAAPRVRRDDEIRSGIILRIFAVERFIRAIIFGFIAYAVWRFKYSRSSIEQTFNRELPAARTLLRGLGYNVDHSGLVGLIKHSFTLDQRTLTWLALGAVAYTLVEIAEGTALWLLQRWGEYFALIATSLGIPYEIYELVARVTVIRVTALVINIALVVYLILSKRLLGARGGKAAYEARLRSESIMQAAIDAAAQQYEAGPAAAGQPGTGQPGTGRPAAGQQDPGLPAAGHPDAEWPAAGTRDTRLPAAEQPGIGLPVTGPGAARPPGVPQRTAPAVPQRTAPAVPQRTAPGVPQPTAPGSGETG